MAPDAPERTPARFGLQVNSAEIRQHPPRPAPSAPVLFCRHPAFRLIRTCPAGASKDRGHRPQSGSQTPPALALRGSLTRPPRGEGCRWPHLTVGYRWLAPPSLLPWERKEFQHLGFSQVLEIPSEGEPRPHAKANLPTTLRLILTCPAGVSKDQGHRPRSAAAPSHPHTPRMRGSPGPSSISAVSAQTSASRRSGERPDDSPSGPKSHIWSSSSAKRPACTTRPCS